MNRMLNLFILMLSAVAITNCQKKAKDTLEVTPQNLVGTWEVNSDLPYTSAANAKDSGYQETFYKSQVEFTENSITQIFGDELGSITTSTKNYTIDGKKIVTQNSKKTKTSVDFEITSLKKDSMTIKSMIGPDVAYNLKRIDKTELVSQKAKTQAQNSYYQLSLGKDKYEETFSGDFRAPYKIGAQNRLDCSWKKIDGQPYLRILSEQLNVIEADADGFTSAVVNSGEPGYNIQAQIPFNFSLPSEMIKATMAKSKINLVQGVYGRNQVRMNFRGDENSLCEINIHRIKRNLSISLQCANLNVMPILSGSPSGKADFLFSKQCVLEF